MQNILDSMEDAHRRAETGKGAARDIAMHEAAEYRTLLKAFLHNETQREYAESAAPIILQEVRDYVLSRGLMTEEELAAVRKAGSIKARLRQRQAEKAEDEIYGTYQAMNLDHAQRDPTADTAVRQADRTGGQKR